MSEGESTTHAIALDGEFANRKIWLVKVPNFVASRWRETCESQSAESEDGPGAELGTITWEPGSAESSNPRMKLTLKHESSKDIPKSYSMNVATHTMMNMLGFGETGPRSLSALGRVTQKFDAEVSHSGVASDGQSVIDPEYRKLSRQRAQLAAKKTRTTMLISQPQITNLRQPVAIGTRRKDPTEKRLAKPAEELTADLFRLFERQPHWVFTQLQRQTDQPSQHLKTVLMEIAVQNKRGPYKDMWELKKGYRLSGET